MDLKVSSTIGYERASQELLRIDDEDAFVERAIATLGPQPPNFENIVALNRGPLVKETVEAHPLAPRQVRLAQDDGALVIDVRTELQFDEAHIPGAISITAHRAGFGSKLAWLAETDQPLVLVARDDDEALDAADLAAAVGLRTIAGYLAGGMTSWREERLDVERVTRMTVPELRERARRHPDPRRPRAERVGRRPHPRLGLRPVPRHPRAPRQIDPEQAGRGHLRLRSARRRRREPPPALRREGRHPRRGRRRPALGSRGRPDREERLERIVPTAHARKHAAPRDVFQFAAARSSIEPLSGTT